ncbi:MAG: endonuclease/exonuclease/phosphatase family protein [Propylenella sp.]
MDRHRRTIRVMTWNIHGGRTVASASDLDRIVALILKHRPDVVALQEVDSRRRARDAEPAFAFLANAIGRHSAAARLITAPDGDYGHAVFSRWPIVREALHDISLPGREPRAAIECVIDTPYGALHVVAAHLGLSLQERDRQARLLRKLAQSAPNRTIVLGDFNDWIWRGSVQRALAKTLPARTRHKTFPSPLPLLALDRIYWRPAGLMIRTWTDPEARKASDHLPIIGDAVFE